MACVGMTMDLRAIHHRRDGRVRGHESRQVFVDHTTASAKSHATRQGGPKEVGGGVRLQIHRRPGVGRQGRGEWRAHGDVRRQRGCYKRAEPSSWPTPRCARCWDPPVRPVDQVVNRSIAGWSKRLRRNTFREEGGLDVKRVVETIRRVPRSRGSWTPVYKTMNDGKFDFGFAVEWMARIFGCLAEARRNGASMQVTSLGVRSNRSREDGGRRGDTSSLLARGGGGGGERVLETSWMAMRGRIGEPAAYFILKQFIIVKIRSKIAICGRGHHWRLITGLSVRSGTSLMIWRQNIAARNFARLGQDLCGF